MRSLVHRDISLHDHLGSARITLDNAARVIESQSYTAYGDHRTHDGEAARTSYIGRETDKESDLGFNGVRLYDPTYGRFLSVDPLWSKYLPLQSYQYAANNPVMIIDWDGREWFDVDGKGTWEYHKNTPSMMVYRINEDGGSHMVEVAGQKELLVFDGESLSWLQESGNSMKWEAVSGELDNGMTNPALQSEKDRGPVPEGDYFVDFGSTVKRQDLDLFRAHIKYPQESWGNYFVAIQPRQLPSGRGGFYIHGGNVPGSKGCIDLHRSNDQFFRAMLSSNKSVMPLFVRYK